MTVQSLRGFRSGSQDHPVWQYLSQLHERHLSNRSGQLASYIPELAAVAPDSFGLAIATTDGFVYEVGDTETQFTIQSVSKAVIYGLALADCGLETVLTKIGVEPSGDAFNSITFDEANNRPFNPMVNAGAIAATALIRGQDAEERFARILDIFRRFTGRQLDLDEAVYRSEALTGHRNRAIAYLELNSGMIDGDVDTHLDLYFRQCSLLVTARDLAMIGATLANGGLNPVTGERALEPDLMRSVLSVMNSCGMYDYAGGWQFNVGIPAKSGVGGGIAAVLPGQLGIGTFSPRLDAVGNSARGVAVCEDISRNLRLHLFEDVGSGIPPFRRTYRGDEMRSKRMRRAFQNRKLDQFGHLVAVYELQGELSFSEAERVTRRLIEDMDSAYYFVLDLTRVLRMDAVAFDLIAAAKRTLTQADKVLAIVSVSAELPEAFEQAVHFPRIDVALEHFENQLLERAEAQPEAVSVAIENFDILSRLSPEAIAVLKTHLRARSVSPGEVLIRQNSEARELYFLTAGRADVEVRLGSGEGHRLSTIEAGNVFGELALFERSPRTADVIARAPGEVLVLDRIGIAALRADQPSVFADLVIAVGQSLAERLRRANMEIRTLSK